jgi:hypothetical protein
MRPLSLVKYQPERSRAYLGSPSVLRLPDGALLVTHDYYGTGCPRNHEAEESLTSVYRSEDNGATWVNITHIMNCYWSTLFLHRGGLYIFGTSQQYGSIFIRRSDDGGFTWTPWRLLLDLPGLKPCEPAVVRSPDGKQLLVLIRENVKRVALFMTSDDEGRTWSAVQPLPPGLWGDRHMAAYAPDGRLVVAMRDTGADSPSFSHFIAWVGRYEDVVAGRDGAAYRLKLLHSFAGWDCGYPGLEVLPDGTFVATTYVKYRAGPEKQSVVATRFNLTETDGRATVAR